MKYSAHQGCISSFVVGSTGPKYDLSVAVMENGFHLSGLYRFLNFFHFF
ncbi:hypothetical protein [Desulfocicer vacuolatum]|nr:hypothetical protein [Desulfocicer vacuolatum]